MAVVVGARLVLPLAIPVGTRREPHEDDDGEEAADRRGDVRDLDDVDGEDGEHGPPVERIIERVTGRALRSPWRKLAALLLVAAIACGVIAAATWKDFGIEGAYLNRSVGEPAYSGVFSSNGDVTVPRVLLGVAIGLAVAAALILAVSAWQSRRSAGAPAA